MMLVVDCGSCPNTSPIFCDMWCFFLVFSYFWHLVIMCLIVLSTPHVSHLGGSCFVKRWLCVMDVCPFLELECLEVAAFDASRSAFLLRCITQCLGTYMQEIYRYKHNMPILHVLWDCSETSLDMSVEYIVFWIPVMLLSESLITR